MLTRVGEGQAVEGMEALIPVLVEGLELLVDVLPKGSLILAASPELIRTRAAELVATSQEFLEASWAAAAGGGSSPIDLGASAYWALGDVRQHALESGHRWWSLSPFMAAPGVDEDGPAVPEAASVHSRSLDITAGEGFRGDTDAAVTHIRTRLADGWKVVLTV